MFMVCNHGTCLEVFANPLRMSILELLQKGPKTVNEITSTLDAERTRVSHALMELKKCHVISAQKDGRTITYSLNSNTPLEGKGTFFQLLERHTKHNCHSCHREEQSKNNTRTNA